jgi:hypothetical protein
VRAGEAMLLRTTLFGAACLLCGCTSNGTTNAGPASYVYGDWLYYEQGWYDDDFWDWFDEHPDCCDDQNDLKGALQDWYDGLDPAQKQEARDRVQAWMDDHGVVPAAGQSAGELVLETASERWTALTAAERRQWLDQRVARVEERRALRSASSPMVDQRADLAGAGGLDPEQRAALSESAQGMSFDPFSDRGASGAYRSISRHPTPSRAGLSGGPRFQAARGGGRAGRGGRGR